MRYPDDFDTPTFPAGKRIASTRIVATLLMVVFLLIVFVCVTLSWARHSVKEHPFIISINEITGNWDIVGHKHIDTEQKTSTVQTLQESVLVKFMQNWFMVTDSTEQKTSTVQTLQESVLVKFMQNWFMVTDSNAVNNALWQECDDRTTGCNMSDDADVNAKKCTIYCLTGDETYASFVTDVLPDYQIRVMTGEMLTLDLSTIDMLPISEITDSGSVWQIRAKIISNINPPIEILAYASIAKNSEHYHKTLGYYVEKFNAYKIK